MLRRPSVLIVADDDAHCVELKKALARQKTCEVYGPLSAIYALRSCAKRMPEVLLVHLQLRDITAAEFCTLIRGRSNGTAIATLFFGQSKGRSDLKLAALPPADGFIAAADLPTIAERISGMAAEKAHANAADSSDEYRGRHLEASFTRVFVAVDGVRVDLARRELALLQFLVANKNRILRRQDILGHVWRNENDGRSRTVDVHVRRLRAKLGAAGRQIETVTGIGYRFSEP